MAACVCLGMSNASAGHIPIGLDVPIFRPAMPGEGYLNFTEPDAPGFPPLGVTESFTGFTASPLTSTGDTNDYPIDNGATHGDVADFDWVVENRCVEVGACPGPAAPAVPGDNHPGLVGFMEWTIGPVTPSAHAGHGHDVVLDVCADGFKYHCNPAYDKPFFNTVDVFSVISYGLDLFVSDNPATGEVVPREAALDYEIVFCSSITLSCATPIPIAVFIPGWHPVATSDDYIARWTLPGKWTHVLIDPFFAGCAPPGAGPGCLHDDVTQIDAIKAAYVPVPGTAALIAAGLAILAGLRRRRT